MSDIEDDLSDETKKKTLVIKIEIDEYVDNRYDTDSYFKPIEEVLNDLLPTGGYGAYVDNDFKVTLESVTDEE